jgi:hypothetical protein
MTEQDLQQLKYPIGPYARTLEITDDILRQYIVDIESFPGKLSKEVESLSDEQLDTAYRPNGWTIRQVVHHCADSHINCVIRFKLALTEDNPTIKPYGENPWAELADSKKCPLKPAY